MSDRAKAAARYNTYAEKVKAAEPPHRLLSAIAAVAAVVAGT